LVMTGQRLRRFKHPLTFLAVVHNKNLSMISYYGTSMLSMLKDAPAPFRTGCNY